MVKQSFSWLYKCDGCMTNTFVESEEKCPAHVAPPNWTVHKVAGGTAGLSERRYFHYCQDCTKKREGIEK